MPSLTAKDRISLCLFTYEDGRRCRTPRISTSPHFCFYHAQKESQSQATQKLADDIAFFFSSDCLSANDLNTALGRLIPAVIRGEIKPRLARTVAYMLQTMLLSTRQAQQEFVTACGEKDWRHTVVKSINANHDYRFPPPPKTAPPPRLPRKNLAPPTTPQARPTLVPTPTPSPAAQPQPQAPPQNGPAASPASPASPAIPASPACPEEQGEERSEERSERREAPQQDPAPPRTT
jgi:hypothetical protein